MPYVIRIAGVEELRSKLVRLGEVGERYVIRKGQRAAAKVIYPEVMAETREFRYENYPRNRQRGTLKASIKIRAIPRNRRFYGVMIMSGKDNLKRRKIKTFHGETYYGAFVNYGHKIVPRRGTRVRRSTRKWVTPRPFLTYPFKFSGRRAGRVAIEVIRREVESYWAKQMASMRRSG